MSARGHKETAAGRTPAVCCGVDRGASGGPVNAAFGTSAIDLMPGLTPKDSYTEIDGRVALAQKAKTPIAAATGVFCWIVIYDLLVGAECSNISTPQTRRSGG